MTPKFRETVTLTCQECGESSKSFYGDDPETWRELHIARHARGRCTLCGHWRDEHKPTTEAVREWLKRPDQMLCCDKAMGMGNNCLCEGDDQ